MIFKCYLSERSYGRTYISQNINVFIDNARSSTMKSRVSLKFNPVRDDFVPDNPTRLHRLNKRSNIIMIPNADIAEDRIEKELKNLGMGVQAKSYVGNGIRLFCFNGEDRFEISLREDAETNRIRCSIVYDVHNGISRQQLRKQYGFSEAHKYRKGKNPLEEIRDAVLEVYNNPID